jgi:uncharacterized protein YgiM (DUF1202 family)
MKASGISPGLILLALLLSLVGACVSSPPQAPGVPAYVTSEIAYLRDGPEYEGHVLGQFYKGDQVEKLESNGSDWWRVRSGRSSQVGWMQGSFLSLNPVPVDYYYVTPNTVPLRECPGDGCASLQLLYRGDRVQKVEKNDRGWWRVLVAKGRSLGWLPENTISESQEVSLPNPQKTYYYVAVKSLRLRLQPMDSSEVIKTLRFNDQLQKLAESPAGWIKVRHPASGAVGWVSARYLETLPLKSPRGPTTTRKPPAKLPAKPAEALPEPEIM